MKNGQTKFRVHRGLTENLLYLCVGNLFMETQSFVVISRTVTQSYGAIKT